MEVCTLDEIGDVGGKFLDDRLVETLDVLEETFVFGGNKVDGNTLTTETTGTTDTVKVVFGLRGQVIVDDHCDGEHVDSTSQDIGRDEHICFAFFFVGQREGRQ